MISVVKQVIATDHVGAKLADEQLAEAGVEPGDRAAGEIRLYGEVDWMVEAEGTVLSTEEFVEHLGRTPGSGR
ncbi:MAG: hypothetical protein ABSG43_26100 [Solirubrobacteraceae bacterium]|jgi:predicted ABC-type ATPase